MILIHLKYSKLIIVTSCGLVRFYMVMCLHYTSNDPGNMWLFDKNSMLMHFWQTATNYVMITFFTILKGVDISNIEKKHIVSSFSSYKRFMKANINHLFIPSILSLNFCLSCSNSEKSINKYIGHFLSHV